MLTSFLFLAALVAAAGARPAFRDLSMHEHRSTVPDGFVETIAAPWNQMLRLRIGLKQTNMAGLEEALYAVSTPGSASYGQHLTKEEVEKFATPSPESVSLINQWLSSNEINASSISSAGDWLQFFIPVNRANKLLNADYKVFTHFKTGKQLIRTMSYSIPSDLQDHINLVHPTITFDMSLVHLPFVSSPKTPRIMPERLESRDVPSSCQDLVTPACLQALYGIPTTPANQSSNRLAVPGFIDQFANNGDLKTFLATFRPDLNSDMTFSLQTLDGGRNPQDSSEAGVEANLDIQYTVGVASGVPTTFISVGEDSEDGVDGFLDIINVLLRENTPPQVLTTSYGFNERDLSGALTNQLCNAYMQLGARGTSVLFASGDGGVAGAQSEGCTNFIPTFPSGCPFITSVGATSGVTETAADFSSGGFSNNFPRPSYQSNAVSRYIASLGGTHAGRFDASGRAFPDVSAQGENIQIVVGGEVGGVDGTSASSPIFASVIALLNDQLIAAGRSPLGFLNPFLYSAAGAAALNDITTGDNPGCNTLGFSSKAGWDPVTGLGTPNFAKLKAAVGL